MVEVATVFTNLLRLIIAPDFGRAISKDKDQSIRSCPDHILCAGARKLRNELRAPTGGLLRPIVAAES
jgi:hypothetical protein